MARFYGQDSGYLSGRELRYFLWSVFFILAPLAVTLGFLSSGMLWPTLAAALVSIAIIVQALGPVVSVLKKKSYQYYRGRRGEIAVEKSLRGLSDSFAVFRDVRVGQGKGNIDFIVVGPPGVFTVEAKSLGGQISFNGQNLTVNGRPARRDFLRQAHGQAMAVKRFIKEQAALDVYVNSVLAFSSPYASMQFGYEPVKNVYVVQKEFLPSLFMRLPARNFSVGQKEIERRILDLI